jgi:hypothetical protein
MKRSTKRLVMSRETVRHLSAAKLAGAAGGGTLNSATCTCSLGCTVVCLTSVTTVTQGDNCTTQGGPSHYLPCE